MKTAEWGPKGRKSRPTADSGGGVVGEGVASPSPPARSGERCELPQQCSGRSPDCPKVFHYFLNSGWPFLTIMLLIVDKKIERFLSHSILSQLLWIWWCCAMFLVQSKFTVEKSKEMVFRCISLWQYWSITEKTRHWGGFSPPARDA